MTSSLVCVAHLQHNTSLIVQAVETNYDPTDNECATSALLREGGLSAHTHAFQSVNKCACTHPGLDFSSRHVFCAIKVLIADSIENIATFTHTEKPGVLAERHEQTFNAVRVVSILN